MGMQARRAAAGSDIGEAKEMPTIQIDSSDLKRLVRELDRIQAKLPQAISRGLNEGGDRVRTQVQRALQQQSSLLRYGSVTKRVRTARAFPGALSYSIVVSGKPPTKPAEFRSRVTMGKGGGVTIWMWSIAHKFKRSFQQLERGGLRMRLDALRKPPGKRGGVTARLPIRGFDGPNLAKEAVKNQTAKAFFDTTAAVVAPIVEKNLMRALK
jgi:hypothetical protein